MAKKGLTSNSTVRKTWYKSNVAIILLLLFFAPVGIYLMWRYTSWNKPIKISVSVVLAFFTIIFIGGIMNPTPTINVDNVKDGRISTDSSEYIVSGTVLPVDATVTVNDKATLRADTKFSVSIALKDGDNQITVKATSKNKVVTTQLFVINHVITSAEQKAKIDAENAAKKKAEEVTAAKKAEEAAAKKQAELDAAAKKAAAEAAANAPKTSFGNGIFLVNKDIQAGTYKSNQSGCYYARLSGTGGTLGEIISNGNSSGPVIVTIAPSDAAFESDRCGTWSIVN